MKNKKKVAIKAPKRNLFTLLIVIAGLVVAFFVTATIVSYASLDKQMHEPFKTENQTYNLEDAIYMDGTEFKDFGLEFICSEFDNGKAKFKISTYKFEEQEIDVEKITIKVCLTADYLDYCKYSTERTHKLADSYDSITSSSSSYTHTVDLVEFPAKVDAFPFDITVDAPKAYVYLQYKVTTNKIETKTYVLEFDYEDFNVQIGGISK
jgi:hypothetical protein